MRVIQAIIVCGYGCKLVPELVAYLDKVVEYLIRTNITMVIACGGFTHRKSRPGVSEAKLIADYLKERVPDLTVLIEDDSYTTYENIRNAAWRMLDEDWQVEQLAVSCEATRALKVDLLARHFLERQVHIETDSWEQGNPTKELIGTVQAWFAIRFPFLNTIYSRRHQRMSETR